MVAAETRESLRVSGEPSSAWFREPTRVYAGEVQFVRRSIPHVDLLWERSWHTERDRGERPAAPGGRKARCAGPSAAHRPCG
jgi:hypothetical protein